MIILFFFCQVVWPSLALIGGVDTGYCLGRSCQLDDKGDQITATLAGIPDADQRVEVQEQVTTDTAKVKKRFAKSIGLILHVSMYNYDLLQNCIPL